MFMSNKQSARQYYNIKICDKPVIVGEFKYGEQPEQIKNAFMKKLRADSI
jgi:hypothetical protein